MKRTRKIISVLLALCLAVFALPLNASASPLKSYADYYSDVPEDAWYADAVGYAYVYQLMNGVGENSFSPNRVMNRAMVVTILHRLFGSPETPASIGFSDVPNGAYYQQAVAWAVDKGITTGTGKNFFSPNTNCTRGQIVTFFWRAAGKPEPAIAVNPFSDVSSTDYFYKAVLWAVENQITTGLTSSTFGPSSSCTRAQGATFLMRFRDNVVVSKGQMESGTKVRPLSPGSFAEYSKDGKMTQLFDCNLWGNPSAHGHYVLTYDQDNQVKEIKYFNGVRGDTPYDIFGSNKPRYYDYTKDEITYTRSGEVAKYVKLKYGVGDVPYAETGEEWSRITEFSFVPSGNVLKIYGPIFGLIDNEWLPILVDTKKYSTVQLYREDTSSDDGGYSYSLYSSFHYSNNGTLTSFTDKDGDIIEFYTYHADGKPASVVYYSYRSGIADGGPFKELSRSTRYDFSYDGKGRLEKLTQYDTTNGKNEQQGYYSYAYNTNDSLTQIDYSSVEGTWTQIQIQYDIDGRLSLGQRY